MQDTGQPRSDRLPPAERVLADLERAGGRAGVGQVQRGDDHDEVCVERGDHPQRQAGRLADRWPAGAGHPRGDVGGDRYLLELEDDRPGLERGERLDAGQAPTVHSAWVSAMICVIARVTRSPPAGPGSASGPWSTMPTNRRRSVLRRAACG